ncbi:MAG: glycosyltransferase family 1 protein [Magnetococcales bacterium]|nr:glycosyltransferase family 1 protein [Magnetococcales bacterium]
MRITAVHHEMIITILQLANEKDRDKLARYIQSSSFDLEEQMRVLHTLLYHGILEPAFLLAHCLEEKGCKDWLISIALCFGGLFSCDQPRLVRGIALLQEQTTGFSWEQRQDIFDIIDRVLTQRATFHAIPLLEPEMVYLLEICKAGLPLFRSLFDGTAPVPVLTLEKMRGEGSGVRIPFAGEARPVGQGGRRSVVLHMADTYILHRLSVAMQAYGWQVAHHPTANTPPQETLVEHFRRTEVELLLLRLDQIVAGGDAFCQILEQLRREQPALKIVALSLDSWTIQPEMESAAPGIETNPLAQHCLPLIDGIWCSDSPRLSAWKHPLFAGKLLHAPLPHAGHLGPPDPALRPGMHYVGAIKHAPQWHRLFWQVSTKHLGLPVSYREHPFMEATDPLSQTRSAPASGMDSLLQYERHKKFLHDATVVLNLTRKKNLKCIVNHRSFEAPLNGALLVQEYTPDMHTFFIPGEHYLEFNSLAELAAIARFLVERPEEAEQIRRCGSAFAREHYNDNQLIGYLDKFLWH